MRYLRLGLLSVGLAGASAVAVALAAPPTGNSDSDLAGGPGSVRPVPRPAVTPIPRPAPKVVARPAPQLASKPQPQIAVKPAPVPAPAPRTVSAPQVAERAPPSSGAIDLRAPSQTVAREPDREPPPPEAERDRSNDQPSRHAAGRAPEDQRADDRDADDDRALARNDRDDDRDVGRDSGDQSDSDRYASRDDDRDDDRDEAYAGRDPRMQDRPFNRDEPRDVYWRERRPDFRTAVRLCERAGLNEARDRRFYSIEYLANPRLVETRFGYEVRGRVELEDRRGFVRMSSTCTLERGRAVDFELYR